MLSWVWPVPAWPANERDENSDDIDPKNLVDLAAEVEVEGEEAPAKFKTATNYRSRPTPSVATNVRNLKASFPSVFSRL